MKQPKQRSSKVRPVPIPEMRVPPADVVQRKFTKSDAEKYAANFDFNKLGYPIVNHRHGIYWIVDGQHRIEALKLLGLGDEKLDCEVYENMSDAEMADMFLGRDDRRQINPFTKFQVACTAERPRETGIRRIVEAQGLRISKTQEEGCIGAVGALGKVYDRVGDVVLGQTLRTIKNAYASDPAGFDGAVIEGVSLVFNRYNGRTNERDMAARLAATQHGVRGLMRRAESQRERTGNQKAQCIAAAVVEIYNKGVGPRGKDRLPSWWKEA